MSLKLCHTLTAATFAVALLAPRAASAENARKAACVAALDQGQSLQSSRKLRDARKSYVACSSDACPAAVREDCSRLLLEVDAAQPTVVLSATVDGRDATDARASIDGEALTAGLDGRAIALDPGAHVARFERLGSAPIDVRILAKEGEKNRLVMGSFVMPRAPARQVKAEKSGPPVLPIVLAGTGALAIGGSFLLRADASSRAEELQNSCAPACSGGERDALSDKLVLANVTLAVGLGALAASAVTWLIDSKR